MKILMVEDEKYIAKGIAHILRKNNYSVDLAYDGELGLDCALSNIYDIILLDIMIPKINGIEILKKLRKSGIDTPVLMLTAKSLIQDKVYGLDSGADDYLAKPFEKEELLARIRALARRNPGFMEDGILKFEDIELNPHTLLLHCKNKDVKLTLKESQLLELLIRRKDGILTKEMIIEKLWGYDTFAEYNNVEYHVYNLRKKLINAVSDVFISTVHKTGYALKTKKGGI